MKHKKKASKNPHQHYSPFAALQKKAKGKTPPALPLHLCRKKENPPALFSHCISADKKHEKNTTSTLALYCLHISAGSKKKAKENRTSIIIPSHLCSNYTPLATFRKKKKQKQNPTNTIYCPFVPLQEKRKRKPPPATILPLHLSEKSKRKPPPALYILPLYLCRKNKNKTPATILPLHLSEKNKRNPPPALFCLYISVEQQQKKAKEDPTSTILPSQLSEKSKRNPPPALC